MPGFGQLSSLRRVIGPSDLIYPFFSWDQNSLDFQTPCESRLGFCDASALADTVAPPWEPHTAPGVKKHNAEHLSTEQGREF